MSMALISFEKTIRRVVVLTAILCMTGCYQRQLAPELNYSTDKVEQIRDEIEKMDWE